MRLWIFVLLLGLSSSVFAFGHDGLEYERASESSAVLRLSAHLDEAVRQELLANILGPSGQEEHHAAVGALLLEAAREELVHEFAHSRSRPALKKLGDALRRLAQHFNPVRLGRWVADLAWRHGPWVASAYCVSEVAEQLGVMLVFKYPELAFLLPVYFTHASDFVVVGMTVGIPRIVRTLKLWHRHGGVAQGPSGYFAHVLSQRHLSPVDWDVALAAPWLGSSRFAVIDEGRIARALPPVLQRLFRPHVEAQNVALPTVSIRDLEKLADRHGLDLRPYRRTKDRKRVYLALLLKDIHESDGARTELAYAIETAGQSRAFHRPSALTPDLAARRLLWFLRHVREELLQESESRSRVPKSVVRQLSQVLDSDKGLVRIAESRFSSPITAGDWKPLIVEYRRAVSLLRTLAPGYCEEAFVKLDQRYGS